jgi:hypothetical protein
MGDRAMSLGEAELLRIGDYVKGNLKSWLQDVAPSVFMPDPVTNTQLLERIVRLEERFEHVDDRFLDMERRFDAVDKRFEAVDKRFEAVDKRFEAVDKRFDDLIHHMDKRLGTVQWLVIAGLAAATIGASLLAVFLS